MTHSMIPHTEERPAVETRVIDGIEVRFYHDTYKFVPEGYALTEEDQQNLERDDYFISEGVEEIEMTTISSIIWEQDDIQYELLCHGGCDAETLFEMARELIEMA